jgi:hypothetical protein
VLASIPWKGGEAQRAETAADHRERAEQRQRQRVGRPQHREGGGEQQVHGLEDEQDRPPVVAIGERAPREGEDEVRDRVEEPDHAEGGGRAAEQQDDVADCGCLHPRADQREEDACRIAAKRPVLKRFQRAGARRGGLVSYPQLERRLAAERRHPPRTA